MIFRLFRKNKVSQAIMVRQYGILTTVARTPAFFETMNVPDTVMGRFEMLSVALILYFRRTSSAGDEVKAIAQDVVEAFFEDLDHSMRELGIGDNGVPKRMKKLAGMFYGRLDSYARAMENTDEIALEAALRRNIHPENADGTLSMHRLAHYMLKAEEELKNVPESILRSGEAHLAEVEQEEA
ncbi:MAG: ubiquinol-cytochrome chaperone family protein [Rhizobium sp.]|nr:ubiquinol-cytochrome chaperone family protein [Rhizobium sp.]